MVKTFDEGVVVIDKFLILSTIERLEQNGIAVYFHHDHNIFVATLGLDWILFGLIGEDGFSDIIDFGEDVLFFLAME